MNRSLFAFVLLLCSIFLPPVFGAEKSATSLATSEASTAVTSNSAEACLGSAEMAEADLAAVEMDQVMLELAGGSLVASLASLDCVNWSVCTSSSQCGGGICRNGRCRCICEWGARCNTKLDCGFAADCYNNQCVCY